MLQFIGRICNHRIFLCWLTIVLAAVGVAAQTDAAARLNLNQPIEREIKGGETHRYQINLKSGQYARAEVWQKEIDVAVSLFAADGGLLLEMDGKNDRLWREALSRIAVADESVRIEIKAHGAADKTGKYTAVLVEQRPAEPRDSQRVEAERHLSRGKKLYEQGGAGFAESIKEYEAALKLWRELKEPFWEAVTLFHAGWTHSNLSNAEEAAAAHAAAAELFRRARDPKGEGKALTGLGGVYFMTGQFDRARENFERALTLAREIKDRRDEGNLVNGLGILSGASGNNEKALEFFERALTIRREIKDRSGEGVTLANMGQAYDNLSRYEKAQESLEKALAIVREINDRRSETSVLIALGVLHDNLGLYDRARDFYEQSLAAARQLQDRLVEAKSLNNLSLVYEALKNYPKAIEYQRQALKIHREIEDPAGEAVALLNLGNSHSRLKQFAEANDNYEKALKLAREVGDRSTEGYIRLGLGEFSADAGKLNEAREHYRQALTILREIKETRAEGEVCGALMRLLERQKQPRAAVFYGKQAVNAFQEIRANIKGLGAESKQNFLKSVERTYRALARLLITQKRYDEALQVLNSFKDQAYFDFQQKQNAPLALTAREQNSATRYAQIGERAADARQSLDEFGERLAGREPTADETIQIKKLDDDWRRATEDFLSLLAQVENDFARPAAESDRAPQIAEVEQLQAVLRELSAQNRERAVAVYTLVGETHFDALIVTPDRVDSVSTAVTTAVFNAKAQQLWRVLKTPKYEPQFAAVELYRIVFAPLAARLPPDTRTILWSLDGSLRYVPIAALHDGKQYLVERFENVTFTRADKERLTRAVSPTWTGTGLGSSEAHTVELLGIKFKAAALPSVKTELDKIFKDENQTGIFAGDVLLDQEFTRARMLSELKNKRPLVHIASHFKFEPGDEARSFLLLGDGTPFTLDEIKREEKLFEGVELLALSACQTAAQRADANGREVDGFAELAQRLGAGAVMASLWEVSDNSTAELMTRFYANKNNQMNKAAALRRAQLALLKGDYKTLDAEDAENRQLVQDEEYAGEIKIETAKLQLFKRNPKKPFAHPFYWSPFVLIGNWR